MDKVEVGCGYQQKQGRSSLVTQQVSHFVKEIRGTVKSNTSSFFLIVKVIKPTFIDPLILLNMEENTETDTHVWVLYFLQLFSLFLIYEVFYFCIQLFFLFFIQHFFFFIVIHFFFTYSFVFLFIFFSFFKFCCTLFCFFLRPSL